MDPAAKRDYPIPFELIDGKVVMMSPRPRVRHVQVASRIANLFDQKLRGKRCTALPDGVDLILDEKNHFIPDAMIVCDPDKIKDTCVEGAPDLVVEVLSPSTAKRDRGDKAKAYAQAASASTGLSASRHAVSRSITMKKAASSLRRSTPTTPKLTALATPSCSRSTGKKRQICHTPSPLSSTPASTSPWPISSRTESRKT